MPTSVTRPALSLEYIQATVVASVALASQTVAIAVVDAGEAPIQGDFTAASWVDAASTTNTARLTAAAYTPGTYDIYVQVTATPEIPVLYAGQLIVT